MADVPDLFDPAVRESLLARIDALRQDAPRRWGKMDAAQMLAHCALGIEAATGERPIAQKWFGKILGPFFRGKLVGPDPFTHDAPTAQELIVSDARDFGRERARLASAVRRMAELGPDHAARHTHGFLGKMTGTEWGRVTAKHLDHHLRQFGG